VLPTAPAARSATAIALGLLAACYALSGWDAFDLGWGSLGAARAGAILGGEPWRAVTALFLHTGPVHLVSNLIFGALFGFLVAHAYGGGLGWLAILLAGALGNATNAWIQDAGHVSVGASTAVFGAVGCLAGAEWRRRNLMRQRRLRRAAPVVIAVLILALHGVPQDDTVDVLAHVTGLAWGLPLGALLPALAARAGPRAGPQLLYGAVALALVAAAWAAAFASAAA